MSQSFIVAIIMVYKVLELAVFHNNTYSKGLFYKIQKVFLDRLMFCYIFLDAKHFLF